MIPNHIPWPPRYIIKKNQRVRHVKLKTSLQKGLELVVPIRFKKTSVSKILEINKSWIIKQLTKLRLEFNEIMATPLPSKIHFPAIHQTWKVKYISTKSTTLTLIKRPKLKEIVLVGNIKDKWSCKQRLSAWVKARAERSLARKLQNMSERIGLHFSSVSIRSQRTRWASCTYDKKIHLDYRLLFLPAQLCNHILIHELCHTVQLNHSPKFWRLVAKHDRHWENHNSSIRTAEQFVPAWARAEILRPQSR